MLIGAPTTFVITRVAVKDSLPAASRLLTSKTFAPWINGNITDHAVVPPAGWKGLLPIRYKTSVTATLSDAAPETVIKILVTRTLVDGEVTDTRGLVTSTKLAVRARLDCMTKVSCAEVVGMLPLQF